ncbi:MAG: Nicotinate-nucleotide--dimethylbenzimidazole phosphoribosyltransferase [candidate division WS2 bacterium]|uniref:Nicotinate-nucleotide--dimethylbenzimidazole phosphoribosyltransferase n=1 Tax=Psychracetigena formicireducens TaxID=2986056 RepID=A0A9E2BEK9_PSYF1|nr:Nicotinate-nucleotide--dimethylbenzimidazole phosphoribosyltransferase [Candidatus Psychracetigena formicireducens]MBT9144183.1 Nicotinate-nucleotide--dimethylbenzimidazole phosphoribosyltransferase [Candidatus Psychracetigena formicireducens]MBT9149995.1 Nicotinate-nucleotide--dimethylbenzimidazole phosphoribosyltransferase [Candidatus Psychracetigena formicireducens]
MELIGKTINSIISLDREAMAKARVRQDQFTKPRGSLGRLEEFSNQGDSKIISLTLMSWRRVDTGWYYAT